MNKRQAKAWACYHCGLIIESQLNCGWPDEEEYKISEQEQKKLVSAIKEIRDELLCRGKNAPDEPF